MTQSIDWRAAHWVLYDYTINDLPRKAAFNRLRALGLSPREAVEFIHTVEQEG